MVEDPTQRQNTTLPVPPPFWRDFTPDKIALYENLVASRASSNCQSPANGYQQVDNNRNTHNHHNHQPVIIPPSDLPEDLINLQPPPVPRDGKWRTFGDLFALSDELPTLEEQNIERLIPANTGRGEGGTTAMMASADGMEQEVVLKRCAKSLLLNFLEVVSLMAKDPFAGLEKSADLRTIFINFHHAINEYRPHQARESLVALMQDQLDRMRAETQANREAADKAKRVLEGLGSITIPDDKTLFPPLFPPVSSWLDDGVEDDDIDGYGSFKTEKDEEERDKAGGDQGNAMRLPVVERDEERASQVDLRAWDAVDEMMI